MIDLLNNLMLGFNVALSPTTLMLACVGCVLGTIIGALPGLGPSNGVAILIPISFVGIYSLSGSHFDLLLMIGFGFMGYLLRKIEVPLVPIILGILLGNHMEVSLRRAMVLSDGNWTYLLSSPIAIGLWLAAIIGFIAPIFLQQLLKKPQLHSD